jgi:hypothetical protein
VEIPVGEIGEVGGSLAKLFAAVEFSAIADLSIEVLMLLFVALSTTVVLVSLEVEYGITTSPIIVVELPCLLFIWAYATDSDMYFMEILFPIVNNWMAKNAAPVATAAINVIVNNDIVNDSVLNGILLSFF